MATSSSSASTSTAAENGKCTARSEPSSPTPDAFFKLGEIREPREEDFQHFLHLADVHDDWTLKHDKNGVRVWMRDVQGETVKMLKVWAQFPTVSCSVLYDMLQDSQYRHTWDEALLKEQTICLIEGTNSELGYYCMKCPSPLRNRDFVYQRCWRVIEDKEYITFNHSVAHDSFPPTQQFIRAVSRVTGFLLRDSPEGCQACYVTHSDPRGKVPKWLLNIVACKITPRIFTKIARAAEQYTDWKSKHEPDYKPWINLEQNEAPVVSMSTLSQFTDANLHLTSQTVGGATNSEEEDLEDTDVAPEGLNIDPLLLANGTNNSLAGGNDVTVTS